MPPIRTRDFRSPWEWLAGLATLAAVALSLVLLRYLGTTWFLGALAYLVVSFVTLWAKSYQYLGSGLQVTRKQLPALHEAAEEMADHLDIPAPRVYVVQNPQPNAFTTGFGHPYTVVLTSGLVDLLEPHELRCVLAHEFGHAKANHVLFGLVSQVAAGSLVSQLAFWPLRWLFFAYQRAMEQTADRAALVASMDVQSMITGFIKVAVGLHAYNEMDITGFLSQLEDLHAQPIGRLAELLSDADHPFTLHRIRQTLRFYRSNRYQSLAARYNRDATLIFSAGSLHTDALYARIATRAEKRRELAQVRKLAGEQQAQVGQLPAPEPLQRQVGPEAVPCPTCGHRGLPGDRFCGSCGGALAEEQLD